MSNQEPHSADPDHSDKPDSPGELSKPSWVYVGRRTLAEFSKDQCTDQAAALTYFAVLSIFPAIIFLLSLVGLVGQGPKTAQTLLGVLSDLGANSLAKTLGPTVTQLSTSSGTAGIAFIVGLVVALWSASGYVGAFSRSMNRVYDIGEGRPVWKLRPLQLGVTLVVLVLSALIALALVVSGPIAKSLGSAIGLGSTFVLVYRIAKWPIIVIFAIVIVAILYYALPNVRQPKFRWLSLGATFAIVVWILASVAFGFYVANFSSYNKTYGSLAGIIVLLLWLWITNLALLFGAELDAELERSRELQAGLAAEESILLPPRDTTKLNKARHKQEKALARARALRRSRGGSQSPDVTPSSPGSPAPEAAKARGRTPTPEG